jgi:hypothetical protein
MWIELAFYRLQKRVQVPGPVIELRPVIMLEHIYIWIVDIAAVVMIVWIRDAEVGLVGNRR